MTNELKTLAKPYYNKSKKLFSGTNSDDIINLSESGYVVKKNKGLTIKGGKGNDDITGTSGNDSIIGGVGRNTFNYSSGSGNDVITLTKGENFTLNFTDVAKEDLRFEFKKNDLRIYTSESEYVTIKNFLKNVTNNAKRGKEDTSSVELMFNGAEDSRVDLRTATDLYKVKVSKNYTGTWLSEEIDASGVTLYKNKKKTIEKEEKDGGLTLKGGKGDDTVIGTKYSDKLYGNVGDDTLNGGRGNNYLYFSKGDGNDTVENGGGVDTLVFAKGTQLSYEYDGDDLIISYGNDSVTLKDFVNGHSVQYIKIGNKVDVLNMPELVVNEKQEDVSQIVLGKNLLDTPIDNDDNLTETQDVEQTTSAVSVQVTNALEENSVIQTEELFNNTMNNEQVTLLKTTEDVSTVVETVETLNESLETVSETTETNTSVVSNNETTIPQVSVLDVVESIQEETLFENESEENPIITEPKVYTNIVDAKKVQLGDDNDILTITGIITDKVDTGNGNDEVIIEELGYVPNVNLGKGDDIIRIKGYVGEVSTDEDRFSYLYSGELPDGNDTVIIEHTADCGTLYGCGGDDTFEVYGKYHRIDAGDGVDTVNIYGQTFGYAMAPGTIFAENVTIHEGGTAGTIYGSINRDGHHDETPNTNINIHGTADYIGCGSGNDTINVSGTVRYIQTEDGDDDITISGTVIGGIASCGGNNTIRTTETANVANIEFYAHQVGHDTLFLNAERDNLVFAMDDLTFAWSEDGKDALISNFKGRHTVTVKDFDANNTSVYVGDTLLSELLPNINSLNQEVAAFNTNNSDISLNYNDLGGTDNITNLVAEYMPDQPQI